MSKSKAPSVEIIGSTVVIDGTSYKIPASLHSCTDEQLIAFYKGWYKSRGKESE